MKNFLHKTSAIFLGLCVIIPLSVAAADLTVESDNQHFIDVQNKVELSGDVRVKYDDVNVKSPRATVNLKDGKVKDVKFFEDVYSYQETKEKTNEIKSRILEMSLLDKVITADGKTQSTVLQGKIPTITVTADTQAYDNKTNIITASGGVVVRYKDIDAFADNARVDLDKQNNVKRIELNGNGRITQKDSTVTAHRFVYYADKKVATADGNVFTDLKDEKDSIKVWSDYQQINQKTNVMSASGHAKIIYKDFTATGPRAVVFPDNKGKLNRVVFSGRSKITQETRSVEADKIVLTLNPKDFNAEGNVKTFIGNVGNGSSDSKNTLF